MTEHVYIPAANQPTAAPVVVYTGPGLPPVQPGDLWRGREGFLLFVTLCQGRLQFVMFDHTVISLEYAARRWSPLHRLISGTNAMELRDPPLPVVLEEAQMYEELHKRMLPAHPGHPDAWQAFEVPERPTADETAVLPLVPAEERQEAAT